MGDRCPGWRVSASRRRSRCSCCCVGLREWLWGGSWGGRVSGGRAPTGHVLGGKRREDSRNRNCGSRRL
eukprot:1161671-Pelagomonas_calceolata.AAC.13